MKTTSRLLSIVAAVGLLIAGCWMLLPSRNTHGNPHMESLIASCETSGAVVARLYAGNGGATAADWYTVTLAGVALGEERQVFFAYREPRLSQVECRGANVLAHGKDFTQEIPVASFATMRSSPIQHWSGELRDAGPQPMSVLRWLAGGVAILSSAALMVRLYAASRHRSAAHAA